MATDVHRAATAPKDRVLLVDDDASVRLAVKSFLDSLGLDVAEAESGTVAEKAFVEFGPDVVILDFALPDTTALDLLPRLKAVEPDVPILFLTGKGTIELAVQAIREGAEQFLTKPVELDALAVLLERLFQTRRERARQRAMQKINARNGRDPFAGPSAAIRRTAEEASRVAAAESPILLLGETGVGKGVLARWLHDHGPRADEPFVDLNCAGLSRELLESELFGHEKGAFTGAVTPKPGLFEVAHRGTAFLDEIGDTDPAVQAKLLKVIEEKRFRRLGDVRDRTVDVRLIAATHHDLNQLVREKKFREDLFYRINALPIRIPALRDRPEDIPTLAETLLASLGKELGRAQVRLDPEAAQALGSYPWPGNIRELRNVLERALLLSDQETVRRRDLRFENAPEGAALPMTTGLPLAEIERRYILRVLDEQGGHVARAAQRLGVPRSSLYQRLKNYGINLSGRAGGPGD